MTLEKVGPLSCACLWVELNHDGRRTTSARSRTASRSCWKLRHIGQAVPELTLRGLRAQVRFARAAPGKEQGGRRIQGSSDEQGRGDGGKGLTLGSLVLLRPSDPARATATDPSYRFSAPLSTSRPSHARPASTSPVRVCRPRLRMGSGNDAGPSRTPAPAPSKMQASTSSAPAPSIQQPNGLVGPASMTSGYPKLFPYAPQGRSW